jgi:PAS domain S-box-containing protein
MNKRKEKAERLPLQDKVSAGELQKKNELLTALFDYSVKLGYIPFSENFYIIAAQELKRIFGAFGVTISTYNPDASELVLQYTTFSETLQKKAGRLFGRGLEGMRFKVSKDIYKTMTNEWAKTVSSLHEVSFGAISPALCKIAEKAFHLGWFSGICLQVMNTVVGTAVIIGRKGTNPPAIEELKGFSGVTAIALSRWLNEQKALLTEMKYKSLAENMKDVLWQSDIFSKITYISPSVTQILGYRTEELLNRSFSEIISPESLAVISPSISHRQDLAQKNRRMESIMYEIEFVHRNGNKFWAEVVSNPVYDPLGNVTGFQGVARDISERKSAESEIRLQYEKLARLNAEKDKFFSIIAHDLKGALHGFLGYSKFMADRIQNLSMDKLEEYSGTIRKIALNLNELLENLLEWSVMQRNHVHFSPEELNLNSLLEKCIETIIQQAHNKEIKIIRNISPDLRIFADCRMVSGIIRNLVSNAVKYTPRKGQVEIDTGESTHHFVVVRIRDNGIGMNKDTLGKLFRIDSVMPEPGTEGESSTGLGLILCKEYIVKHNGNIWFESEVDKGTCVHFTLPLLSFDNQA